jgi:predicted esterase
MRGARVLTLLFAAGCQAAALQPTRDAPSDEAASGVVSRSDEGGPDGLGGPGGVERPTQPPARAEPAALAPLPAEPLFTNLAVPGFPEAVVSMPNGARARRPTLVVLHGTGDRPDYNCDAWRHITGAWGFVLCLRGDYVPAESTPGDRRFTLHGGAILKTHLEAALAALGARFGDYVDVERPVLAGFSLGAWQVARLALASPQRFSRVALVEGGSGAWTRDAAAAFFHAGGQRVLIGCGSPGCSTEAAGAAKRLAAAGLEARWVYAPVGHTTDRPLQEAVMKDIDWFLSGDARWAPGL